MISNERVLVLTEIVHYCNPSGEETRIRNRFNLNSVQAEAYLTLLKQRQLFAQNDGKYHITERREFSRFLRQTQRQKIENARSSSFFKYRKFLNNNSISI